MFSNVCWMLDDKSFCTKSKQYNNANRKRESLGWERERTIEPEEYWKHCETKAN